MMHDKPLISIIMPAFNAERYIEAAIRSILAQSYITWELFVIDDGSTDATGDIATSFSQKDKRIRYIYSGENAGVAATRNKGLSLCCGEYVAFIDSDDIWLPNKLESQLHAANAYGADFIYTSYAIIDKHGKKCRKDYHAPNALRFEKLLRENVIGCSTVMVKAEVIRNYQFRSDYFHEDYLLWLEILRDGYYAVGCGEVLTHWRLSYHSRSADKVHSAYKRWLIYRRYLQIPFSKCIYYFLSYALNALRKYL